MKKVFFFMLVAFTAVSALFTTFAGAKNVKTAYLAETRFVNGKGVVFLFNYTGKFKDADFKGAYIFVDSKRFNINCGVGEWEQISCSAPGIDKLNGKNIVGAMGGFRFRSVVPSAQTGNNCLGRGFSASGINPLHGYRFNAYTILPNGKPLQNFLYPGEKITSKLACIVNAWPGYPNPYYRETVLP
jgi:hypothetical protein